VALQARMSEGDRRLYNPGRDVAHNFQEVMNLVAGRLEDEKWPELKEILDREEVDMDEVGEACGAYCRYITSAADEAKRELSMIDSMRASGFLDCKPAAQVAVLAMIGTCYAGIQFGGIREATIGGEGPLESIADVGKHAERLKNYVGKPRWRRKLSDLKRRIGHAFQTLRGE
jgi:hypothetical protein